MTDDMSSEKLSLISRVIQQGQTAEFAHNRHYYEIFESVSNDGYVVNVYSNNDKDENGDYIESNLVDGGLCTGSARDAVVFML